MRHLFSWAIAEGQFIDTPFKCGSVSVVKMESSVEGARTRRLEPSVGHAVRRHTVRDGEEACLLKQAGPHLRALIVAALATGCRLGELLSLQLCQGHAARGSRPGCTFDDPATFGSAFRLPASATPSGCSTDTA